MRDIRILLGKRIKTLRHKRGISQQKLAEIAGIDQRSLSHIECGDTFPSRNLDNIANALNVELSELFEFDTVALTSKSMITYIKKNIEFLSDSSLEIIFKMVKFLK